MVSMVLLKKINEEKRKLEVMVKIFGRKTPLELGFMQVESIIHVTYNIYYNRCGCNVKFFKKWLKKLVK
jgi:hypothetical protein